MSNNPICSYRIENMGDYNTLKITYSDSFCPNVFSEAYKTDYLYDIKKYTSLDSDNTMYISQKSGDVIYIIAFGTGGVSSSESCIYEIEAVNKSSLSIGAIIGIVIGCVVFVVIVVIVVIVVWKCCCKRNYNPNQNQKVSTTKSANTMAHSHTPSEIGLTPMTPSSLPLSPMYPGQPANLAYVPTYVPATYYAPTPVDVTQPSGLEIVQPGYVPTANSQLPPLYAPQPTYQYSKGGYMI